MSFPKYPKYKPSGVEWLGDVPEHWNVRRLGYYFTERRDKVNDVDYPPLSVTKNGIVPQLETAAKTDDNDNRRKVCRGDFVINSRSDRKGSSGMASEDGSVSLINTVLQPFPEATIEFAHHLFRSYPFQEEFYRYGKGIVADLWSTNYSEMKNISLAMPSEAEQTAIAAFLDAETSKIDALIAEQRRLIELLKEKRQAVISHAVTQGLNPNAPMKPSGIEWLGDVPEHWDVEMLSRVTTKIGNGFVGPTRDILVESGVPYIQATHIKRGRVNFDGAYFVTPEWAEWQSKAALQLDDVLIVQTGAGTGDIGLVSEEEVGYRCHALIIVRSVKSRLLGSFLSAALQSQYGRQTLESIQTGGMHPHLNCGNVKVVYVPVPPTKEQGSIVVYVNEQSKKFDSLEAGAEQAIELLQERRTALISAAVTGKIDVREFANVEAA